MLKYGGTALVSGVSAAAVAFVVVLGWAAMASEAPSTHGEPPQDFPTNRYGLTYGSDANVGNPAHLPDLIQVIGDSGRHGFVLKEDNDTAGLETPKTKVPVFSEDGQTQIDTFTIAPPDGVVSLTEKEMFRIRDGESVDQILEDRK